MASKISKRKSGGTEDTSSSVELEDTLKLDNQQRFADTECKINKGKTSLQWGDIYRAIK